MANNQIYVVVHAGYWEHTYTLLPVLCIFFQRERESFVIAKDSQLLFSKAPHYVQVV